MIRKDQTQLRGSGRLLVEACFLCVSILLGLSLSVGAQEERDNNEILAIGTATVVEGNLASARAEAITSALRKGVEQYLARRLGSREMAGQFRRIIREVVPRPKEKIENFSILAEDQMGEEYKVLVLLKVNKDVMEDRLKGAGLIFSKAPAIKLLFMVSEKIGAETSYWWEDPLTHTRLSPPEVALHRAFQNAGLNPVNRTSEVPETEYGEQLRMADLPDQDIITWGKLFGADVVVYGQTEVQDRARVSMALKALHVARGMVMCEGAEVEAIDETAEWADAYMEALKRVTDRLVQGLTPSIIEMVTGEQSKPRSLQVTVEGISSFRQYISFRNFLRTGVPGVQSVLPSRIKKGSVSMTVEYQGESRRFLDLVLSHEGLPFSISLEKMEGEDILFRLR